MQEQNQPEISQAPTTPMESTPRPSLEYASFWQRFGASFLDGLVTAVVLIILILVFGGVFGVSAQESGVGSNPFAFAFIWFFYPIALLYSPLMVGKYGATLGKMTVHIKVVDEDGQAPTMGKAFLRELIGKFVSGLIPFAIGYLWILWDSKKQTVHDKIAGTYVVKVR